MDKPCTLQLARHLTLRQLQVFEAIARHLSYTRAAEELYLTQPTVSAQIKNLTQTLGLPLFDQIGKKIYLTPAGDMLLRACRQMFETLGHMEMELADIKGLKQGQLRLAVVSTAKYFVPRVLGPFCERYPGIDVSLKVTNRERVLERLQDNVDDIYILSILPEGVDVEAVPFISNPMMAVARRDHPLLGKRRIPLARFADEPFLLREPGSGTRLAMEQLFAAHGLKPKVRMELGSNEAIKQGVAGGLGVSVLSQHVLTTESDEFAVLDVEGFPIECHWYLIYPRGKQLSVVAQTFFDYLLGEGKAIAEAALTKPGQRRKTRAQGPEHAQPTKKKSQLPVRLRRSDTPPGNS